MARGPKPRLRRAIRGIVLTPDERILLLRYREPDHGRLIWLTPGGGANVGETHEDCLRRELEEETGLHGFEPGPLVWRREQTIARGRVLQREHFYLVRTAHFEPVSEQMEGPELDAFLGYRWWRPPEIERSADLFSPRNLGRHLRTLIDAGPPSRPIDVGR